MQNGNWIPISKYFSYALPKNRMFNDLEAMYSLQLDYDNNNTITILGCSSRWGWSRTKVINFLLDHEIVISYPDELKSLRKKRGFIDIVPEKKRHKKKHKEDNKETIKEHKRFIDSKWITDKENNKKAIKEHKKSNRKVTTIDPNIILNPESKEYVPQNEFAEDDQEFYLTKKKRKLTGKRLTTFLRFWEDFNYKKDKASAADSWFDIPQLTELMVDEICEAAKKEAQNRPIKIKNSQTPIFAQGWLTAKRWEDEQQEESKTNDDANGNKKAQREIEETKRNYLS